MSTMKKGRGSLEKTESRDAWIMMTPALIVLTIVAVYPILRTFWLSLHEMVLTERVSVRRTGKLYKDFSGFQSIDGTCIYTEIYCCDSIF